MVCHAPEPKPEIFNSVYARHLVSLTHFGLTRVLSLVYWLRCTRRTPDVFLAHAGREMRRLSNRVTLEVSELTRGRGWDFELHLAVLIRHVSRILFERTTWYLHGRFPDRYRPVTLSDSVQSTDCEKLQDQVELYCQQLRYLNRQLDRCWAAHYTLAAELRDELRQTREAAELLPAAVAFRRYLDGKGNALETAVRRLESLEQRPPQ